MLTKTQIVNHMNRLDHIILNAVFERDRCAAYDLRLAYANMLFNHQYVY